MKSAVVRTSLMPNNCDYLIFEGSICHLWTQFPDMSLCHQYISIDNILLFPDIPFSNQILYSKRDLGNLSLGFCIVSSKEKTPLLIASCWTKDCLLLNRYKKGLLQSGMLDCLCVCYFQGKILFRQLLDWNWLWPPWSNMLSWAIIKRKIKRTLRNKYFQATYTNTLIFIVFSCCLATLFTFFTIWGCEGFECFNLGFW